MRTVLPSLALLLLAVFALPHAARTRAQSVTTQPHTCGGSWQTYTYPGEEFSVALPDMPALDHESRSVRNSPTKIEPAREYGAYGDGIVYVMWAYDNPRHDEDLNYFADYFFLPSRPADSAAPLRAVRDLKLDGFAGRQFQPAAGIPSSTVPTTAVYVYVTKKHAYAFRAVGADESHPCVERFLNSFSLSPHTAARLVADEAAGGVEDAGVAPAAGAADSNGVLKAKDVTRKAIVVTKPEPGYTERARKDQITGTVMMRMVLGADGKVSAVTTLSHLPEGLTENAVRAARHIKFIPAVKDGRNVSQYVTVVYNFNIY